MTEDILELDTFRFSSLAVDVDIVFLKRCGRLGWCREGET